ncbi:MAG: TM0106 family RecB-like putative nuclease, partial [Planctomycetota bacterium]
MTPLSRPLTPTAFTAFTECPHSTTLDLACDARGEKRPRASGEFFELITRKGNEHEEAHVRKLEASGVAITRIPPMTEGPERARELTLEAMRRGDEVIYQAFLTLDGWRGAADFLVRTTLATELGAWGYEPVDTKLARKEALPHHVLQLSYYAEAIAAVQGCLPELVHVELGSGEPTSVRTREVIHYARHQRRRFERFVEAPTPTVAYPNAHCTICAHRTTCESEWRDGDHPSYVARIRRGHVLDLAAADPPVTTLTALTELPDDAAVVGIKEHTLSEIRRQAQFQRASIEQQEIVWEFREREPDCGYDLLPEPCDGDIYLDLEGDPVWRPDRSLVFLFGWIERDASGEWQYETIWAHDEASERAAYDDLVSRIRARRTQHPEMHVYHYSHAETSMLRAIAAIDMDEIEAFEDLIASGVFIDLYKVVRQGLRIGVESYGLKSIERLAGFQRLVDVAGGSDAVVLYEQWMASADQTLLDKIASYNDEDCRATLKVHEWLRAHPATGTVQVREEHEKSDAAEQRDADFERREDLAHQLRERFPADESALLLASLLNYHEREERVKRRELTEMINLPASERFDDGRIIDGLTPLGDGPSGTLRYTWSAQDHKVEVGSVRDLGASWDRWISVTEIDERNRELAIAFPDKDLGGQPVALAPYKRFNPGGKPKALEAIAVGLLDDSPGFDCSHAILRR